MTTDHPNLPTALAAFQATLPSVSKGNTATIPGKYSYDYANLTDVQQAVLPLLAAQGLAWHVGLTSTDNGTIMLEWELTHGPSDQSRMGMLPVGRAGDDWQKIGSASTYAQRYALTAAVGVAPGGDDNDGAGATAGSREPARQAPIPVAEPSFIPDGKYDIAGLKTIDDCREMYNLAIKQGDIRNLIDVGLGAVPFGSWLRQRGTELGEAATPDEAEQAYIDAEIAAHEAEVGQ